MQTRPPQELLDFSGKVVLVTGAGSGIGRAIALRFAQAGAAVSLHYRDSEAGARSAADEIIDAGGRAEIVRADLRFAAAAQVIVDHTVTALGTLDVLINNAGSYPVAPLLDLSPDQWRDVMSSNLDSVHYCTQAAAHVMRLHGGGAVVNIASIEALNPAPGHAHYTSAKSGGGHVHTHRGARTGRRQHSREHRLAAFNLERRPGGGVAGRRAGVSESCAPPTVRPSRGCRGRMPVHGIGCCGLDHRGESCRRRWRAYESGVLNVKMTAQELISLLKLSPLPEEGGYFRETWRANLTVGPGTLPIRYTTEKSLGTAIYYLLTSHPDSFSALHRLPTDEIYHFYVGDAVEMLLLASDGSGGRVILGQNLAAGQHVQFVVPAGTWQGSRLMAGGDYVLLGTTMAPGFDPADYQPGSRADLIAQYPQHASAIRALTRR